MILEALRRSVVRWFKRPATSVPSQIGHQVFEARVQGDPPPQAELDKLGVAIIEQLKAAGIVGPNATVKVRTEPVPHEQMPGWDDYRQANVEPSSEPASSRLEAIPEEGVKPPADPAIDDGPTWGWWEAQRGLPIPGWTFCRFGARFGDKAMFAFGWVRGPFGLHQAPLQTCSGYHPNVVNEKRILVNATHLLTGHQIGVFDTMTTAIDACELADRLDAAWANEDRMTAALDAAIARTNTAWMGVGIVVAPHIHAHAGKGRAQMAIITRTVDTVMEGKPERMS